MFHIQMRFWLPLQPIIANENANRVDTRFNSRRETISQGELLRDVETRDGNTGDDNILTAHDEGNTGI
ncbi:hypothetical protein A6J65_005165 [Yersinia enterocolitica]|nr:hypothetical protein A6J65_005165 [Yersinia enterocolitica]